MQQRTPPARLTARVGFYLNAAKTSIKVAPNFSNGQKHHPKLSKINDFVIYLLTLIR
jgi:hypothetical protein